jgi:hypothetical protein
MDDCVPVYDRLSVICVRFVRVERGRNACTDERRPDASD